MTELLLTYRALTPLPLPQALADFAATAQEKMPILLYSRAACEFAWLHPAGAVSFCPGSRVGDLAQVFEARAFNQKADLRWVRGSEALGEAAILTETTLPLGAGWGPTQQTVRRIDDQLGYVLWGSFHQQSASGDWAVMAEARIGSLCVPWVPQADEPEWLRLRYVEYAAIGADGNMGIVAERLQGIEAYQGERNG